MGDANSFNTVTLSLNDKAQVTAQNQPTAN